MELYKMPEYYFEDKRKENANAYNPWSESEEELLKNLLDSEKSIDQISETIQRSSGAIISRLHKIGYEIKNSKSGFYNEIANEAVDYLTDILEKGDVTHGQIIELLKKLINAVQEPRSESKQNSNMKNI